MAPWPTGTEKFHPSADIRIAVVLVVIGDGPINGL
jgi:hypothetical protein